MNVNSSSKGQIITFYSYKGGVGRSMALANIACLLSQQWMEREGRVLMIDWDLEAPGLSMFFRHKIKNSKDSNVPMEQAGLIDLFYSIKSKLEQSSIEDDDIDEKFFDLIDVEQYFVETTIPFLYLMSSGRLDDNLYSSRVNSFNWDKLFANYPSLMQKFAEYLRKKFRYTLIDSRTGYTDISGICTSLMPEKLVVIFTPNRQSLNGVLELVRKSTDYRKQSDDLRPLIVFPLASRIENAESKLQKDWRFGNQSNGIIGYQPQFEAVLEDVYKLKECNLTKYFDEVQIQYKPRYSYGEELAVLSERIDDRLSIAYSYQKCAQRLIDFENPWETRIAIKSSWETHIAIHRKLRVFLSYSSEDKFIAHDFYRRLSTETWIDPWLDEERIFPGMNRDVEIKRAVGTADAVIVCLSSNSIDEDGAIRHELQLVLDAALKEPEGTIFVIPLKLDECQVPHSLRSMQYIDFSSPEDRKHAYDRLLKALSIKADMVIRSPGSNQSAHFVSPQNILPEFDFLPLMSVGFDFVKIPQGRCIIGSKASNSQAREDEIPQFPYTIPYDYWINRFPISNQQFAEFAVSTKRIASLPADWRKNLNYPIVNVSWHDAVSYTRWLNKTFSREIPMGLTFRLPTEAEWERASRGDTGAEWPWGDESLDILLERDNHSQKIKKEIEILRRNLNIVGVGSFSPLTDSPFGVADMMGSIHEWTQSLYDSYPYDAQDGRENLGTKGKRVIRGCFTSKEERLSVRSARRACAQSDQKVPILGFRIVIAPPIL